MYALASLGAPPLLRGRRGTICAAKGSDVRPGVPRGSVSLCGRRGTIAFAWQALDNVHRQEMYAVRFLILLPSSYSSARPPTHTHITHSSLTHTHSHIITLTHSHSISLAHHAPHTHTHTVTHTLISHTHTHITHTLTTSLITHSPTHIASPCHVLARIFGFPAACSRGPRKFDIQDR